MSKANKLQRLWDSSTSLMPAEITYSRRGWYAMPNEARWFNDEGEWLGDSYEDALSAVEWHLGRACDHDHLRYLIITQRPPKRAEALLSTLATMSEAEHAYWSAKCSDPKNGKRALKALCILLSPALESASA